MVEFITLANSDSRTIGVASNNNQQIIVIPQSLLNNNKNMISMKQLKPMVKVAPNNISLKRPLPPSSPESECDESAAGPVRKRANLDHLTPEEKMMRRKLKNRVAAQNARDKKRLKMDEMENRIKKLEEESQKLREQNERLMQLNERLMSENQSLKSASKQDYLLPPSPDSMPPNSPLENDSTIVVPRASEPAELANELLPKGQALGMAVTSNRDKTAADMSAAACLFLTCLVTPLLTNSSSSNKSSSHSSNKLSSPSTTQPTLPLKKRPEKVSGWKTSKT